MALTHIAPSATAQVTLGVNLPAGSTATITQGGPPNFADTYATPFVVPQKLSVFSWKAQAEGGRMGNGGCAIAVGIQLKVLRAVPNSTLLNVVKAGAVHNPLAALQARLGGGDCPQFSSGSQDAVLEFTESSLDFSPGDIVGLTIMSDPNSAGYFYPLAPVAGTTTQVVLRNVTEGNSIDLSDIFVGTLPNGLTPAIQINFGIDVAIDIKPGSYPNTINLGSAGVIPVAILSTADFDATTIDPDSLRLAGASVGMAGKSGKLLCHTEDVNGDGRNDLLCQFETSLLTLQPGDTMAVLVGTTLSGVPIRGQDTVSIVPD